MCVVLRRQPAIVLQSPAGGAGALGGNHQHQSATLNFAHRARRVMVVYGVKWGLCVSAFIFYTVDVGAMLMPTLSVVLKLGVQWHTQVVDTPALIIVAPAHHTCTQMA